MAVRERDGSEYEPVGRAVRRKNNKWDVVVQSVFNHRELLLVQEEAFWSRLVD